MSLNKQQLEVVNQTNFPDNNTQLITPALLREFNTDIIDSIQLTGSYATTGSNSFVGNQTIAGNLSVTGVISASVLYVQTETSSVIYSSGSNQFGDELSDIQTLSGSVKVQGSLTVNGTPVLTSSADVTGFVTTSSFNAYTSSNNQRVSSLETNSASVNISITNINSATQSLFTSVNSLNQFTQSQSQLNGTFATTGSNTFTGNQIIDRASKLYTNGIYWTDPTAGFNNLEIINQIAGNLDLAALNGGVRIVSSSLNITNGTFTASLQEGFTYVGNGSNRTVLVATSSFGTPIPAGTVSSSAQILNYNIFATTGSNAFFGTNSFSGAVSFSGSAPSILSSSFSGSLITNLTDVYTDVEAVQQIVTLTSASYASLVSGSLTNPNTLYIVSGSYPIILPSGLLSSSVTNFIDYSASVDSRINSIVTATGFATTGSNIFIGNQTITGSLLVSGSQTFRGNQTITGSLVQSGSNIDFNTDGGRLEMKGYRVEYSGVNDFIVTFSGDTKFYGDNLQLEGPDPIFQLRDITAPSYPSYAMRSKDAQLQFIEGVGSGVMVNMTTSSFNIPSASFTASLQEGYVWVGNSSGRSTTVATSSFGGGSVPAGTISGSQQITDLGFVSSSVTASSLVTASFSGNTLTFTKGDSSTFGVVIPDISGSTIDTGSFATTGSNVFIGDETFSNASGNATTLTSFSGSLVFTPKAGFASSSSLQNHLFISASATGQTSITNIIFNTVAQGSPTGSVIISGSNNIFAIPSSNPAGFQRRVTNGNLALGAPNSTLPQFTSSMSNVPVSYNNNISTNAGPIVRGPISSSAYNLNGNLFMAGPNLGDATESMISASAGLGLNANLFCAAATFRATKTQLVSQVNVNNNVFAQGWRSDLNSSSVSYNNNLFNGGGGAFVNNYYAPSASANNQRVEVLNNILGGQSTQLYASGSNTTTTFNRQINNNFLGGNFCIASASANGDNSSLLGTILYGNNLKINGNSPYSAGVGSAGYGSAFLGRYNAENGTRYLTAETIFAVGTGTNNNNRKTGFLIDSGSNTFIEGTLNVSGATSLNGTVNVTGSLLINGIAPLSGNTGSFATTGSNTFTGGQTIKSGGGLTLSENIGGGGDDNRITLASINQSTLQINNFISSSNFQSGSSLQISAGTGSNGYGFSGSATFQMDALYNGNAARMQVFAINGVGSALVGYADNITFSKQAGFPSAPANTFSVDAYNIQLSGSTTIVGATTVNGAVNITGSLTSSLTEGYVWVGGAGNVSTLVATSSFAGGSVPAGTVSSSAQILNYNIFATTSSNNFVGNQSLNGDLTITNNKILTTPYATITALSVDGGMGLSQVGNPSDTGMGIQSANKTSLYCTAQSISSGYNSGSSFVLTATTGSNAYGFSGSADFNITSKWAGKIARMQVNSSVGTETLLQGSAERISFVGEPGTPNTPSNTFRVEANSIELSGSIKVNTGSSGSAGTAVLDGGNPGTVTVSNSQVTSNSLILLTKQTLNHTNGYVAISSKGTGTFTITSNHNGDTLL